MKDYPNTIKILTDQELQRIHEASLAILADPGMRIESEKIRQALKAAGALVDETTRVVRFPGKLVEHTLERMKSRIQSGGKQIVLNGVVASLTPRAMGVKFGGACIEYLDWETQEVHAPTRRDLMQMVQLGEALPEVTTVGNPVVCLKEDDGTKIDPRMQRVRTAALIARYTSKAGPTEVWDAVELKYLMELGQIVRGGWDAYLANPCFVTAKETISPLVLDENAGDVLVLLGRQGLPCTIIPMPITGTSAPLTMAANIALGNAEILAVFTGVLATCPEANLVGGVISGIFDMKTTNAVFASPEAVLQDIGFAELHERLYGFDFGLGGYVDAKYPGAQIMMEVFARFSALARTGRFNVPVGLLNSGKRFSPVQALLDIEIERWIVEAGKGIEVNLDTLRVDQIQRVGIGGHSLSEDHTLQYMRKSVWYPQFMDRTLSQGDDGITEDMIASAARQVDKILLRSSLFEADAATIRAIDEVVRAAEKELLT